MPVKLYETITGRRVSSVCVVNRAVILSALLGQIFGVQSTAMLHRRVSTTPCRAHPKRWFCLTMVLPYDGLALRHCAVTYCSVPRSH